MKRYCILSLILAGLFLLSACAQTEAQPTLPTDPPQTTEQTQATDPEPSVPVSDTTEQIPDDKEHQADQVQVLGTYDSAEEAFLGYQQYYVRYADNQDVTDSYDVIGAKYRELLEMGEVSSTCAFFFTDLPDVAYLVEVEPYASEDEYIHAYVTQVYAYNTLYDTAVMDYAISHPYHRDRIIVGTDIIAVKASNDRGVLLLYNGGFDCYDMKDDFLEVSSESGTLEYTKTKGRLLTCSTTGFGSFAGQYLYEGLTKDSVMQWKGNLILQNGIPHFKEEKTVSINEWFKYDFSEHIENFGLTMLKEYQCSNIDELIQLYKSFEDAGNENGFYEYPQRLKQEGNNNE